MKELTFSPVSSPTKSCSLNVAVFGLPMIDPVIASVSSAPILCLSASKTSSVAETTPILLAIKAGVSLHKTVCFPSRLNPNSIKKLIISGLLSLVGIISKSFIYLGGLKK